MAVAIGAADPPLASAGEQQADHLAAYLAIERIAAVYSSPMRRARETAAPIGARLGLDVSIVDDVAEWDRDAAEYVPVETLKATGDPRYLEVTRDAWSDLSIMAPFRARVVAAIEGLIAAHAGERIVVACHAGVVNVFLGEVLGLPVGGRGFLYPDYTSIHRVAASRDGRRSIVTVNETAHLRGTDLPTGGLRAAL